LAFPHQGDEKLTSQIQPLAEITDEPSSGQIRLVAERGDGRLVLKSSAPPGAIQSHLKYTGFGFPNARVFVQESQREEDELMVRVRTKGTFTEVTGETVWHLHPDSADILTIEVQRGDLQLEWQAQDFPGKLPPLLRLRLPRGEFAAPKDYPAERIIFLK
jgi:hypothetical protein